MNVFRLDIPNKDGKNTSCIKNQVYDYISLWNGDPGLDKVGCNLTTEEVCRSIGEFVVQMSHSKEYKDTSRIRGILIYDDDMGNFIEGYVYRGEVLVYLD